jgi:aminoglycoside phosphotransferase family enzyme/predicted kinase
MSIPDSQQDVARFLSGLSGSAPQETHISAVFVGADTVWKLKKAVRLPFIDFSSLTARGHFLRRELALNKPAAPGIYRDIQAVVRGADGALALAEPDAEVAAIDWVLRMARIPASDFIDVMARQGRLTPRLLDQLGDSVAAYHAQRPPVADWDSVAALSRVTQGNAETALAAGLPQAEVEAWRLGAKDVLRALSPWLRDRAAAGFVRRCHGDLHLGNLCLWDGVPVPFDALEFDEAMATTDTAYDLAFLLMDLDHRVGRAPANRVMNRYLARTGDAGAVRGLTLFLSERAMIRAHVSAASGHGEDMWPYLQAARLYLSPPPPCLLAIGGLQGSGKSTLARRLAPELGAAPGAVVLRSDEIRKRHFGVAPEARLPPAAYADDANAAVNAALTALARQVVQAGHACVLDATFIDAGMRHAAETVAREASVPFLGVWLDVPLPELERRVSARRDDASDATLSVLRRAAMADTGGIDWLRVEAQDADRAAGAIRQAITGIS